MDQKNGGGYLYPRTKCEGFCSTSELAVFVDNDWRIICDTRLTPHVMRCTTDTRHARTMEYYCALHGTRYLDCTTDGIYVRATIFFLLFACRSSKKKSSKKRVRNVRGYRNACASYIHRVFWSQDGLSVSDLMDAVWRMQWPFRQESLHVLHDRIRRIHASLDANDPTEQHWEMFDTCLHNLLYMLNSARRTPPTYRNHRNF